MENYKWCFKKQNISFLRHKYRPHAWQDTKDLKSELSFLQSWHFIRFYWTSGMWVEASLVIDSSWDFCLLSLVVENDLLRLLYLPTKPFATTILKFSNDISSTSFMWTIWLFKWMIKKHAQVKLIFAFEMSWCNQNQW